MNTQKINNVGKTMRKTGIKMTGGCCGIILLAILFLIIIAIL